jgi:hypothetical protein
MRRCDANYAPIEAAHPAKRNGLAVAKPCRGAEAPGG